MASDLGSSAFVALVVYSPVVAAAGWTACRPLLEKLWLRLRVWALGGATALERRLGCDCGVCHEGLEPGAAVRTLSCNHVFHRKCVDRWLRDERMTCPICRQIPAPVLPWEAPLPPLSPSITELGRGSGGSGPGGADPGAAPAVEVELGPRLGVAGATSAAIIMIGLRWDAGGGASC